MQIGFVLHMLAVRNALLFSMFMSGAMFNNTTYFICNSSGMLRG